MRAPSHRMIELARESRGLTQTALAKKIGVSQSKLSKVENQELDASEDLIRKLSDFLDYPIDFFYDELPNINLPVAFFRKRKTIPKRDLMKVKSGINIQSFHIKKLLTKVSIPECKMPTISLSKSGKSVSEVARELRTHWNLPSGPIRNLTEILEEKGVVIIERDFCSEKIDGVSIYNPEYGLPPIIFVNKSIPGDRLRWTIAHETGHIALHHHLDWVPEECEEEADQFASEFLMPAEDIKPFLFKLGIPKLAELKRRWKTSMQALIMRGWSLNTISDNQKRYLFMRMSDLGYRKKEPIYIPREKPTLINEILDTFLSDLSFSGEELSTFLHISPDEFEEQYFQTSFPKLRLVGG